jgi:myosin heavy subunit
MAGGGAATFVEGVDDAAELADVRSSLETVDIGRATQRDMFRVVAGLMHLGNVRITTRARDDRAEIVRDDGGASASAAARAAALLGAPALAEKLVSRVVKVKGDASAVTIELTEKQAIVARDSLAKAV